MLLHRTPRTDSCGGCAAKALRRNWPAVGIGLVVLPAESLKSVPHSRVLSVSATVVGCAVDVTLLYVHRDLPRNGSGYLYPVCGNPPIPVKRLRSPSLAGIWSRLPFRYDHGETELALSCAVVGELYR